MSLKEINLRQSDEVVRHKIVWQELYKVYIENNCSTSNLFDLLVDYDTLKTFFEHPYYPTTFLWCCESSLTHLADLDDLSGANLNQYIKSLGYANNYILKITEQSVQIKRVEV